ncbi:hypothetical protein BsWGS_26021 [Bradybaena similaris]
MSPEFFLALLIMASISVVRADGESGIRRLPVVIKTRQTSDGPTEDCARYGYNCESRTCCQYEDRSEMGCYDGRCIQAECVLDGSACGYGYDYECCYDVGLVCLDGICRPRPST